MTGKEKKQREIKSPKAEKSQPKRAGGRPSSYTKEVGDRICELIATSDKSLKKICAAEDLPAAETVRMWCWRHPEFTAQYAGAKAAQQVWMVERAQEIADDGSNDTYIDDEGQVKVDTDVIQRSRLRVDTIKWAASKLAPKKFGDKIDVNHGGQEGNPVTMLYEQLAGTPFKPKS